MLAMTTVIKVEFRRTLKVRHSVVGVAQLVEPRIVIPVVVGSSPIIHPISSYDLHGRTENNTNTIGD